MKKNHLKVKAFDSQTAERTRDLAKVRVERSPHHDLTFSEWFASLVWEAGGNLRHPKDNSRGLSSRGLTLHFRIVRGKWVTFGRLVLRFYSFEKKQVRAVISFRPEPFSRFTADEGKCEISWLLSESDIVLPALLESLNGMDWKPLKDTGLFKDGFSESPDHGCYVWSLAGERA